jgi:hypothetical protein
LGAVTANEARSHAASANTTTKRCRVGFGQCDWRESIRPNLDARYVSRFVDLAAVRLDDLDVVIPLQVAHYRPLARHPELRGHKFFHPSPDVVALCEDKLRLANFLVAEGFSSIVPPVRPSGAPYPYVWKRRHGDWGFHCHIVKGSQGERALDLTDDAWFAQTLVPGTVELATHILRAGGEIRYASTFAFEMAGPALVLGAHETPLSTQFARGCEHLDLFSEILARLAYEGTACFDYKVVDGQAFVFEINPRYGGSLSADVTAYVDAYVDALT